MRIWKKLAVTALTATAMVGAVPAPAGADAGAGAASFVKCAPTAGGPHCVSGAMTTRIYPTGLGLSVVEFECTIIGSIDPASVTINFCTFAGQSAIGVPSTLPGAVITQVGVAVVSTGNTYALCIGGAANFLESIIGPATVSDSRCSTALAVAVG